MPATTEEKKVQESKRIKPGEGKVGMRLHTPDGTGKVSQVLNADVVIVEIDGTKNPNKKGAPCIWRGDLEKCERA